MSGIGACDIASLTAELPSDDDPDGWMDGWMEGRKEGRKEGRQEGMAPLRILRKQEGDVPEIGPLNVSSRRWSLSMLGKRL